MIRPAALVLFTSLCLAPALAAAQETATPAAAEPSGSAGEHPFCATRGQKTAPIGAPAPGKGKVVFFRKSAFVGAMIPFRVREGETEYCSLSNGSYFAIDADPGVHTYDVHSETRDKVTVEVDEGETYYLQMTMGVGVLVNRPNLSPTTAEDFNTVAAKLKPARY